jgi:hypothetical protein
MAESGLPRSLAIAAVCACVAMLFLQGPASAQTVVGKALVEGKPVILMDDKTWAYEDPSAECQTLTAKLTFCGSALGWSPSTRPTPDVLAAFRLNSTTYSNFIYEDLGTSNGLTVDGVRDILLKIVQGQTGEVPVVIESSTDMIGTLSGETMVYGFRISGLDVVYSNTFILCTNSLLQAQTYEIAATYTDAHRKNHADFLGAIKYSSD